MPPLPFSGLPDPDLHPALYDGVPARRLLAWLVDSLIIGVLTAVVVLGTAFLALFVLPAVFLAIGFVYRAVTLAKASATPGMQLMAIELRGPDGLPLSGGMAVAHTALYTLATAAFPLQLISVVLMATTARGQGLGDILLGTTALNRMAVH
jgi:uncharacterized RDD family membrane protein YckC